MKNVLQIFVLFLISISTISAQSKDPVVQNIINEANNNSQLENLGHELLDVIG
ncbi:MAG: peptidase M28, partial [Flavobacteriaceae bacterium]|nr:peptidase M28 [Flavobacteriaceae bacterium]